MQLLHKHPAAIQVTKTSTHGIRIMVFPMKLPGTKNMTYMMRNGCGYKESSRHEWIKSESWSSQWYFNQKNDRHVEKCLWHCDIKLWHCQHLNFHLFSEAFRRVIWKRTKKTMIRDISEYMSQTWLNMSQKEWRKAAGSIQKNNKNQWCRIVSPLHDISSL